MTEEDRRTREDSHSSPLGGTTMRVYRYVYRSDRPVRVNDVQRGLGLSSPSVAEYHIRKLLQFGLIREEQEGYVIDKVIFSNIVRFRRTSIPVQSAYVAFFAVSFIVMLTLFRPSSYSAGYFFTLLVILTGILVSLYEALKTLRSL